VIAQLTLKLKPKPEETALLICDVTDANHSEQLLAALVHSQTSPTAVELVVGPAWQATEAAPQMPSAWGSLVVGLEGTSLEVAWMRRQLALEWNAMGTHACRTVIGPQADALWSRLCEFPAECTSPLVIKASVRPSAVHAFVTLLRGMDPRASIQAHAGNGIVIARFLEMLDANVSKNLVGTLQPAAVRLGGSVVVLASTAGGLTRQAVWGGQGTAAPMMRAIREQFDPAGILNPGRFVYEEAPMQ
jgi:FAD/FMN-containing dehydrogenase